MSSNLAGTTAALTGSASMDSMDAGSGSASMRPKRPETWIREWVAGEKGWGLWQTGMWCQCQILDRRKSNNIPSLAKALYAQQAQQFGPDTSSFDASTVNKAHKYDYYIHFIGVDRRLDRWMPADDLKVCFLIPTLLFRVLLCLSHQRLLVLRSQAPPPLPLHPLPPPPPSPPHSLGNPVSVRLRLRPLRASSFAAESVCPYAGFRQRPGVSGAQGWFLFLLLSLLPHRLRVLVRL